MYCAKYSPGRDEDSKVNEEETDEIICREFKIEKEKLQITDGTEEDYRGIDRILPNGETIQKKNLKVYESQPKFSETVTVPCKNYEEYKIEKIDWIFHSYYDRGQEEKVRQWVLIRFDKLVENFDERRKRNNRETGTWFYYWPYKNNYIANKGEDISILDYAESYSIP